MATETLSLTDIEASYQKGVKILKCISLSVTRKDIICLIGPNGAGKSTVLKAIMGLVNVERGSVTLDGEEITNSRANQTMRKGVSYVPQGRTVFPEMTVWENLRMGGFILKDKSMVEERIELIYEMFPVLRDYRNRKAFTLSGGEQQMLEMGRVLVLDPKYMLVDEPSLGLAPMIRNMIFEKIRTLNREKNIGILMVEQNAVQGLQTAHFGYVLDMGRIRFKGRGVELLEDRRVRQLYLGGGEIKTGDS
ncbi:MAG: ABC transporter ATP-binding protein [Deltaproteobacteria bacterium]|nr:ABC transporter ATP-binding protein [Deltaproteobacteria bacterium]